MTHPALLPFLDDIDKIGTTLEWRMFSELERYFDGTQYADRELDVDGYRPSGVFGAPGRRSTPSWKERRIDAVWAINAEISEQLTEWSLGGTNWCHLEVPGDKDAEDFLATVEEDSGLAQVIAEARTYGGAMLVSIVSFSIQDGEFLFEAHRPRGVRVLEWENERMHRPRAVVKVARGENPDARSDNDYPWIARYWDQDAESNWVRERNAQGRWVWRMTAEVMHGLGFCPLYWAPNATTDARHVGIADAPNIKGLVDEINELFAAAGATTKRNADDTLVIKTSPTNNTGKPIKKGGFNAIFAENGAEYLSQDGESARVCIEVAHERADQAFRRASLDRIDQKEIAATASGKAREIALAKTIARANRIRTDSARYLIRPLCKGVLDAARKVGASALRLPPREDEKGTLVERQPGTSSFVRCAWPTPFPPTSADVQALVTSVVAGTGNKPVMSQRTAVKMLAANGAVPIENVDEEMQELEHDADKEAEASAKSLGLGEASPSAGAAYAEEEQAASKGEKA